MPCPGHGVVNHIGSFTGCSVVSNQLGLVFRVRHNSGTPKRTGRTDPQRQQTARQRNIPLNIIADIEQVEVGVFTCTAADGKTVCRMEHAGELKILAPVGSQVNSTAKRRFPGKVEPLAANGSSVVTAAPRHNGTILNFQGGVIPHDQLLSPGDVAGTQGKRPIADFQRGGRSGTRRKRSAFSAGAQSKRTASGIINRHRSLQAAAVRGGVPRNGQGRSLPCDDGGVFVVGTAVISQLADGGVHGDLQHGRAFFVAVPPHLYSGILSGLRVTQRQNIVPRTAYCFRVKVNRAVEVAFSGQIQRGQSRAGISDSVYLQHGVRGIPIKGSNCNRA